MLTTLIIVLSKLETNNLCYNKKMIVKAFFIISTMLIACLIFPVEIDYATPPTQLPEEKIKPISVFLVGDIMLDRGVDYYIQQNNDWHWPFREISDYLNQADLVFGNLESMISDQGNKIGSVYSFRANPNTLKALSGANFSVLSVANNHSFDYGREAFQDTLSRLEQANISYVGGSFSEKEAHQAVIKEIDETKIGFLAYTCVGSPHWQAQENSSGIAWMSLDHTEKLAQDIEKAKQESDILIVSLHFGKEYQKQPNNSQKTIAKKAIDYGADLVVGHHPHVLQPLEKHEDGWIVYSLGNFVFDQYFSIETMQAAVLEITIQNKEIAEVYLQPTFLTKEYQVKLAN
jgi:poly-gamma-glutamate capsule biosynthesis protein CapA/YwtB (metallophosphatase superfamily)